MTLQQKIQLIISVFLALLAIIVISTLRHNLYQASSDKMISVVKINGNIINVELARSNVEKEKGLSGRENMTDGEGMLFAYTSAETPSFWMKEMNFPIDIIWIKSGKIIDITAEIPVNKSGPLKNYSPSDKIDKVLEVNAGWAKRHGVKVGDSVIFE